LDDQSNFYKASSSFHLNDQVSQFLISVNVFSSSGKYAFARKDLESAKLYSSNITLPTYMNDGDKYAIPITVLNKGKTNQTIDVNVQQIVDGKELGETETLSV